MPASSPIRSRPRSDCHHHLFDDPSPHAGDARYLVTDLAADTAGVAEVVSSIYVQAGNAYDDALSQELAPTGETRWVMGLDRPATLLTKMVGFADLRLGPAVESVLDAHIALAGDRFAGIRHSAAWHADPAVRRYAGSNRTAGLLLDDAYTAGVGTVHRLGLTFETWIFQSQLHEFLLLARRNPDGPLILDHLGGPLDSLTHRQTNILEWRRAMTAVARCPNVLVKIGGLGIGALTAEDRFPGQPSDETLAAFWADDIHWCIDTFGPGRCMLESNFPVDRRLCEYRTLWSAFDRVIARYSAHEQDQLCRHTAETTYGIVGSLAGPREGTP